MAAYQDPSGHDRSVLRSLRKSGETERDGRGRIASMPPILQYGFRPFFFLAALYAGLAIPAWLWIYAAGGSLPGPFAGLDWHVHEMLFGYLAAVITGFVLTAVPNWTGRLPLSGWPLAGLVALWLAGRAACAFLPVPWLAAAVDLAFPVVLALALWREIIAGRNWKNLPVAAMITLFGAANALHHAGNLGLAPAGLGPRLALAVVAMLIALIGGRIVPSFTRNWLVKDGNARLPAVFGRLDKAALVATAVAMSLWVTVPESIATGIAQIVAGALLAARVLRWRGHRTVNEPILLILARRGAAAARGLHSWPCHSHECRYPCTDGRRHRNDDACGDDPRQPRTYWPRDRRRPICRRDLSRGHAGRGAPRCGSVRRGSIPAGSRLRWSLLERCISSIRSALRTHPVGAPGRPRVISHAAEAIAKISWGFSLPLRHSAESNDVRRFTA